MKASSAVECTQNTSSRAGSNGQTSNQSPAFENNRQETIQLKEIRTMAQNSPRTVAQRHAFSGAFGDGNANPKPNNTGMPGNLKTGLENISGINLSDVKVHYNSSRPAQFQALAYAQGNEIHLGPRQEKYLPHEGWHLVQQRQGRVKPTIQMNGAVVNDDPALEHEADVMGNKAVQFKTGTANNMVKNSDSLTSGFEHYINADISNVRGQASLVDVAQRQHLEVINNQVSQNHTHEPVQRRSVVQRSSARFLADDSETVVSGQINKSQFLAELRKGVRIVSKKVLEPFGLAQDNCPDLNYWLGYYQTKDVLYLEQVFARYAPDTAMAETWQDYLNALIKKVEAALIDHVQTGANEVDPEEVPESVDEKRPDPSVLTMQRVQAPIQFGICGSSEKELNGLKAGDVVFVNILGTRQRGTITKVLFKEKKFKVTVGPSSQGFGDLTYPASYFKKTEAPSPATVAAQGNASGAAAAAGAGAGVNPTVFAAPSLPMAVSGNDAQKKTEPAPATVLATGNSSSAGAAAAAGAGAGVNPTVSAAPSLPIRVAGNDAQEKTGTSPATVLATGNSSSAGAATAPILSKSVLNVVGEYHYISHELREEERAYSLEQTGSPDYWMEDEFTVAGGADGKEIVSGDPLRMYHAQKKLEETFVTKIADLLTWVREMKKDFQKLDIRKQLELKDLEPTLTELIPLMELHKAKKLEEHPEISKLLKKVDDLKKNDTLADRSLHDINMERSKAMHYAAQKGKDKKGVWKIGQAHVEHIKKMGPRDYNLVDQETFDKVTIERAGARAAASAGATASASNPSAAASAAGVYGPSS